MTTKIRKSDISRQLGRILGKSTRSAARGWDVLTEGTRVVITLNHFTPEQDRTAYDHITAALGTRYRLDYTATLDDYSYLPDDYSNCAVIDVRPLPTQEPAMADQDPTPTVTVTLPGKFCDYFDGTGLVQGQDDHDPECKITREAYEAGTIGRTPRGYYRKITTSSTTVLRLLAEYADTCIDANTHGNDTPEERAEGQAARKAYQRAQDALKTLTAAQAQQTAQEAPTAAQEPQTPAGGPQEAEEGAEHYVTVNDGTRIGNALGPYPTDEEARANLPRVRAFLDANDPNSDAYEYGTFRVRGYGRKLGAGTLKSRIGLHAPQERPATVDTDPAPSLTSWERETLANAHQAPTTPREPSADLNTAQGDDPQGPQEARAVLFTDHRRCEHRKTLPADHAHTCPVYDDGATAERCNCHYSDARCEAQQATATPVTVEWTHTVHGHHNATATLNGTTYQLTHITHAAHERGALGNHLAHAPHADGRLGPVIARTWDLPTLLAALADHQNIPGALVVRETGRNRLTRR